MSTYTYRKGVTTGRPMTFLWRDPQGAVTDFSSGYTFTAYLTNVNTPLVLAGTVLTASIIGYSTAAATTSGYNVLINWASGDFTALDPGTYAVELVATPSGGDPYPYPSEAPRFVLKAAYA